VQEFDCNLFTITFRSQDCLPHHSMNSLSKQPRELPTTITISLVISCKEVELLRRRYRCRHLVFLFWKGRPFTKLNLMMRNDRCLRRISTGNSMHSTLLLCGCVNLGLVYLASAVLVRSEAERSAEGSWVGSLHVANKRISNKEQSENASLLVAALDQMFRRLVPFDSRCFPPR
jgi:hypothetical protein